MHTGQRFSEFNVFGYCFIVYFVYKIGLPIPLIAWRGQGIEHAVQRWYGKIAHQVKCRRERADDGSQQGFGFVCLPGICPYNTAHFPVMQVFRERRAGRYRQESKEAVQFFRRNIDEGPVPFKDVCGFVHFPEHGATIYLADSMELEQERGYHAKVAATAADGPEQVRMFGRAGLYKTAVCQYYIGVV